MTSLIKWEPFDELDNFFNDDFLKFPEFPRMSHDLAIDIYEKDGNLIVEMQAAGVDEDKINVSMEDGYLRISGMREDKKENENKNYYSKQISRGSFQRILPIQQDIDEDKIKAEIENGMLKVIMPIKQIEEKKIKKIEVKKK